MLTQQLRELEQDGI
ncbi:hypothetical protein, partial [Enterococcus faecalis]